MKKILVIQNNEDDLKYIDAVLPNNDLEIFYSHNLTDGLEIASRYLPDLILFLLTDDKVCMQILTSISTDEKISLIPLIVVSKKYSFEQQRMVMELGADDYLPAEFIKSSLPKTINRRLEKLGKIKENINNQINSFEYENSKTSQADHILVKIGNKLKLVKFDDIVCITASKEYSNLITKQNFKVVVRKSLKNWISILPEKSFLQIHRATIININYIEQIVKTNERTYSVHLKNIKEVFDFSYRYANIMRRTFPT